MDHITVSCGAGGAGAPGCMHELVATAPGPEAELEAMDDVWEGYAHKSTSELLSIYEHQQEELVKLSKELEEFTKRNIELSTSNLQQLQKLQCNSSPIVANIVMQLPLLSQLSNHVRQQSRGSSISGRGMRGLPFAAAAADMVAGGSIGSRHGERGGDGHMPHVHGDTGTESAPAGICTQEDAAATLLQMSRRMVDEPW